MRGRQRSKITKGAETMKNAIMIAATSLVLCAGMQDPMATEKKAVERAALDYVEAFYQAKPELAERSVHENVNKLGFARRSSDDEYRMLPMTYEQLISLATRLNADGDQFDDDAPKKIKVLDVLDQTASVKLTADWGVDYMHLAKYDGKWKIIQVLWQSVDED
jgi:hypothetical protein